MKKAFMIILMAALYTAVADAATGVPFLTGGAGSRSIGMGRSFVAVADGPETAFYNIAGSAFFTNKSAFISYVSFDMGEGADSIKEEAGTFFIPVKSLYGVLGINVLYVSYGKNIETTETGAVIGEFSIYELAAGLSYATKIADGLGMGVNLKYVFSHLYDEYQGKSVAFDVSVLYRKDYRLRDLLSLQLGAGATLQNIGPAISYQDSDQADDLPRYLRTGVSAKLSLEEYNTYVLITTGVDTEAVDSLSEKRSFLVGAELGYLDMLYARCGYYKDHYYENDGFNWGVGFKYGNFTVDYSRDALNAMSSSSIDVFSLGILF